MNRREFVIGQAAFFALSAISPFTKVAFGHGADVAGSADVLVYIFLRGGMDGLNFLAPAEDANYNTARLPDLRVAASGAKKGLLLANGLGNEGFYMHADAGAFKDLYDNNNMAIVHAAGLKNGTRSHFDAQEIIEKGLSSSKSGSTNGWLTRYLQGAANGLPLDGLPAIAAGADIPMSLLGFANASSVSDVKGFNINGGEAALKALAILYQGNNMLDKAAQETIKTVNYLQAKIKAVNANANGLSHDAIANYPTAVAKSELNTSLKTVADIIKLDAGLKVATVDMGGWDTHFAQPYRFNKQVEALTQEVSAFYNYLSGYHQKLTVVITSEFGRRVKGNKSNGTDHGFGNCMMVLGGNVKGGHMYGTWPGLATENLNHGVDLDITTDYRTILTETLTQRMDTHSGQVAQIFPGYVGGKPLGLFR